MQGTLTLIVSSWCFRWTFENPMYGRYWLWLEGKLCLCLLYFVVSPKPDHSLGSSLRVSVGRERVIVVGERAVEPGSWVCADMFCHSMTSYASYTLSLFQTPLPMEEVALTKEKLVFNPFLNAYNTFLVKDPKISSWSLARLKTPSITANKQGRQYQFLLQWSS